MKINEDDSLITITKQCYNVTIVDKQESEFENIIYEGIIHFTTIKIHFARILEKNLNEWE